MKTKKNSIVYYTKLVYEVNIKIKIFQEDIPQKLIIDDDIAIDTETMGLKLHRDKLCTIQLASPNHDVYIIQFLKNKYHAPNLKKILLNKKKLKIFHYARFDLAIIKKYLKINLNNIFCTKIASKLVRTYTDKHGLKELCKELLKINISKQEQSSFWGDKILTSSQIDYAAKDVIYLHQIKNILYNRLCLAKREKIAKHIFNFIKVRSELDLLGWEQDDIFSYT